MGEARAWRGMDDSWVGCGVDFLAYGTVSRSVARSSSGEKKWLLKNRDSCIPETRLTLK